MNSTPVSPKQESKLPKTIFDVLLMVLVALAVLSYRFPILSGDLYATNPYYDFGSAYAGDEVDARFVVRNLHPWAVTITQIKGSCGCTNPVADRPFPARIAPFETVTVRATLDTSSQRGVVSKPIHIITDANPVGMQLAVKGVVLPRKENVE